jgi:hypothetical protein
MDFPNEGCQVCLCGRSFAQLNAFSKHKRVCPSTKRHLSSALDQAKNAWIRNKRRKLGLQVTEPVAKSKLVGLMPELLPENPDLVETCPSNCVLEHALIQTKWLILVTAHC